MKRLHVSLHVNDIDESVRFYSTLFGAEPTLLKDDYAKWMLDDPRVNFVIQPGNGRTGLNHLGIQGEDAAEFNEVSGRMASSEAPTIDQPDAVCCYAKSNKKWGQDPQGVIWESFHTTGVSEAFGSDGVHANDFAGQDGAVCNGSVDAADFRPAKETSCCG